MQKSLQLRAARVDAYSGGGNTIPGLLMSYNCGGFAIDGMSPTRGGTR